jgi:hypothetical protein
VEFIPADQLAVSFEQESENIVRLWPQLDLRVIAQQHGASRIQNEVRETI